MTFAIRTDFASKASHDSYMNWYNAMQKLNAYEQSLPEGTPRGYHHGNAELDSKYESLFALEKNFHNADAIDDALINQGKLKKDQYSNPPSVPVAENLGNKLDRIG